MDHIDVLRQKIAALRAEIAQIRQLNEEYGTQNRNGADDRSSFEDRNERLQAIQQELVRLAGLGRKIESIEEMKERHRTRLYGAKKVS